MRRRFRRWLCYTYCRSVMTLMCCLAVPSYMNSTHLGLETVRSVKYPSHERSCHHRCEQAMASTISVTEQKLPEDPRTTKSRVESGAEWARQSMNKSCSTLIYLIQRKNYHFSTSVNCYLPLLLPLRIPPTFSISAGLFKAHSASSVGGGSARIDSDNRWID